MWEGNTSLLILSYWVTYCIVMMVTPPNLANWTCSCHLGDLWPFVWKVLLLENECLKLRLVVPSSSVGFNISTKAVDCNTNIAIYLILLFQTIPSLFTSCDIFVLSNFPSAEWFTCWFCHCSSVDQRQTGRFYRHHQLGSAANVHANQEGDVGGQRPAVLGPGL